MAFGTEIKRLRNVHKVSAQVLADAIGIDAERLRSWEKQDLNPRSDDKMAIENYFGMPLELLIKLDKLPKVPKQSEIMRKPHTSAHILKQLIPQVATSVMEFEKEIGVGNGTIGNAWKDNSKLTDNLIRKILKRYPRVSEHWLETGEGEMIRKNGVEPFVKTDADTNNAPAAPDYRTRYEQAQQEIIDIMKRYTMEVLNNSNAFARSIENMTTSIARVQSSLEKMDNHFSYISQTLLLNQDAMMKALQVSPEPPQEDQATPALQVPVAAAASGKRMHKSDSK